MVMKYWGDKIQLGVIHYGDGRNTEVIIEILE